MGSTFTISAIPVWYSTLTKPSFSPPSWVFGPAWTILYALMGIALYLLWKNARAAKLLPLFYFQLTLNGIWTLIFFGSHNIFLGLVDISCLFTLLVVIVHKSLKIDRRVSFLLLPYLAWVGFATLLNFSLWQLNM